MSRPRLYNRNLGISILWGGVALGAAALFALSNTESRSPRPLESRPLATVVNATRSDGSEIALGPDTADPLREIEDLRKKIRSLEAEMIALKRQSHTLDR